MINRWHGSISADTISGIVGTALGAVGIPVLTYLFVPYAVMISKTPVLFWTAMFTPFALWVLFQFGISLYAAIAIRPVPPRDWLRTAIAGVLVLAGSVMYVGPWLATVTYGLLYGPNGPS